MLRFDDRVTCVGLSAELSLSLLVELIEDGKSCGRVESFGHSLLVDFDIVESFGHSLLVDFVKLDGVGQDTMSVLGLVLDRLS